MTEKSLLFTSLVRRVFFLIFMTTLSALPSLSAWSFLGYSSAEAALETALPMAAYQNLSLLAIGARGRANLVTSLIPFVDPYLQLSLHGHIPAPQPEEADPEDPPSLFDGTLSFGGRLELPLGGSESPWMLVPSVGYGMILHRASGSWNRYTSGEQWYPDQIIEADVGCRYDLPGAKAGALTAGISSLFIFQQETPGFRLGITLGYLFSGGKS